MTADQADRLECWAILELMGHRQLAGQVREVTIAGAPFLRIDVPAVKGREPYTQFYGGSSIYAISPTTEEAARRAAEVFQPPAPVSLLGLQRPALAVSSLEDDDDAPGEEF